jgi:nucleoside-diphosphate-sugar epimerase
MDKYVITGGAGFVGSRLAGALVRQGARVKIIDNFSVGSLENIKAIQAPRAQLACVRGDVRDEKLLRAEFRGYDRVYHLAAVVSVPKSIQHPAYCHDTNVNGTLATLAAAQAVGVERLIFASSCAVYGNAQKKPASAPIKESDELNPQSPYALSKLIGERYCRLFSQLYRLHTIALRFFNVYGNAKETNSPYSSVISQFVRAIKNNKRPIIYGNGKQSRDFVHIDDVLNATIRAAHAGQETAGDVFNIGTGSSITINQLLNTIARLLNQPNIAPRFMPARDGDVMRSRADVARSARFLGFTTKIALEEGLKKHIYSL